VLAEVIQQVASTTWFATVSHPAKPKGWDIVWGAQVDPRIIQLTGDGEVTDSKVASYLTKYATKSTEPVGVPPGRITANNASVYADPGTYEGRLIAACLRLGAHPHEDFRALRRWAHMFGYRGHFATKSRRYSTSMRVLRTLAGTGCAVSSPSPSATGTRPSSRSPTCDGLGGAGALPATRFSPCPPRPAPGSSDVSPAKRWP
jgi:hypothetical protein